MVLLVVTTEEIINSYQNKNDDNEFETSKIINACDNDFFSTYSLTVGVFGATKMT